MKKKLKTSLRGKGNFHLQLFGKPSIKDLQTNNFNFTTEATITLKCTMD